MKIKNTIFILVLLLPLIRLSGYCQEEAPVQHRLTVFHSPSCNHCVKFKMHVMPAIEKDFKGALEIAYLDIGDTQNYKIYFALRQKHNLSDKRQLPILYLDAHFLDIDPLAPGALRGEIIAALGSRPQLEPEEAAAKPDLMAYFKSFTPLAVITAGLIDGINPCAFTVIVFFISFLALQGYRRRELAAIGLAFILAVFLTYVFIGLGIFGFFYRLQGFWLLTKIFNLFIGVFSIVLGMLAVYDFIKFRKTKDTEGLILQLPQLVKNRIHAVIGAYYRKNGNAQDKEKKHIFGLIASALVTGFLVSLLEAVCTGQTYLPTITFILKSAPFNMQAVGYLFLYNLMFIIPLLVIFVLALAGITSGQFAAFLKKHLLTVKILMALLFFGLGIFLLWRA